jgi:hypothetical protein
MTLNVLNPAPHAVAQGSKMVILEISILAAQSIKIARENKIAFAGNHSGSRLIDGSVNQSYPLAGDNVT